MGGLDTKRLVSKDQSGVEHYTRLQVGDQLRGKAK